MELFFHYLSTPSGILVAILATLLILYFMLKKLVKLALFVVLILLGIAGYHYFKDPATMPQKMQQTLHDAKAKTEGIVEKGKSAYQKSRELYDKGKELTKNIDKFTGKEQPTPEPK